MGAWRPLVYVLLALVITVPSLGVGSSHDPIQPGDPQMVPGTGVNCTLSWVFDGTGDDAGRVFMSIAAHCVEEVGQKIMTQGTNWFGEIVYINDPSHASTDIALIEVYPEYEHRVEASVRGHPNVPTGVAKAGETMIGDVVRISGWGMGFGATEPTREERAGVLVSQDDEIARTEMPIVFGDSGGPWFLDDGRALAITTGIHVFSCCNVAAMGTYNWGPTVENIISSASEDAGLEIELRTV